MATIAYTGNTAEVVMPDGSIVTVPMVVNDGMFQWLYPEWPVVEGYEVHAGGFMAYDANGEYKTYLWGVKSAG